jgi:hypothetical protein
LIPSIWEEGRERKEEIGGEDKGERRGERGRRRENALGESVREEGEMVLVQVKDEKGGGDFEEQQLEWCLDRFDKKGFLNG